MVSASQVVLDILRHIDAKVGIHAQFGSYMGITESLERTQFAYAVRRS